MTRARDVATQGGLVLTNRTTFTTASSVSLNNCFTSAYQNYRVVLNVSVGSVTNADIYLRMRANGTDDTSSNYEKAGFYFQNNSATGSDWAGFGSFFNCGRTDPNTSVLGMDVFSPQLPITTNVTGFANFGTSGVTSQRAQLIGGHHYVSSAFDGLTFYMSSGTFTGTVAIYGYKN